MYIQFRPLVVVVCLLSFAGTARAQYILAGITGNQEQADQVAYPDVTVFAIDSTNATTTPTQRLSWIPDSHAIGFNPLDGLIYHTGGSEAWSDDPAEPEGFRDHQYLETYDLPTGVLLPVFNANPPPSPDDLFSYGDEAPRPTWVLPQEQRLLANPSPRERGVNEYGGARDLVWSSEEELFYVSDKYGIFKLTADGQSTFVGPDPALGLNVDYKGLSFYTTAAGDTMLLAGNRRNADLYVLDPSTGEPIGDPVQVQAPAGSPYGTDVKGLLGLAQDPSTGVLYGIRRTDPDSGDAFHRELITIDPTTGATELIGNLGLHFSSLTVVYTSGLRGDYDNSGVLDLADIDTLTRESAKGVNTPRYDLNNDDFINAEDIRIWVKDLFNSWIGDANLDREFNSSDLVVVLSSGAYEADVDSVWSTGDFDGDGRTGTSDLVAALSDGGYEVGPRAAVSAVPEPGSFTLLSLSMLSVIRRRRR